MSQTYGKTRWKRFAVVMVPSIAATAAVGVSIAQGALAASFAVSGQNFTVAASSLHGDKFVQYGQVDLDNNKTTHPVAVSGFSDASINDLCQSVVMKTPIGAVTLNIAAGNKGTPVTATDLYIDMDDLQTKTATFHGINIGVAAGAVSKGTVNPSDVAAAEAHGVSESDFNNSFAQEATSADLTDVYQNAWATSAGTFNLNDLHLSVGMGNHPCPQPQ